MRRRETKSKVDKEKRERIKRKGDESQKGERDEN